MNNNDSRFSLNRRTLRAQTGFVQVDTVEGRLGGQREQGLCIFRGVRYAEAPVGPAPDEGPVTISRVRTP